MTEGGRPIAPHASLASVAVERRGHAEPLSLRKSPSFSRLRNGAGLGALLSLIFALGSVASEQMKPETEKLLLDTLARYFEAGDQLLTVRLLPVEGWVALSSAASEKQLQTIKELFQPYVFVLTSVTPIGEAERDLDFVLKREAVLVDSTGESHIPLPDSAVDPAAMEIARRIHCRGPRCEIFVFRRVDVDLFAKGSLSVRWLGVEYTWQLPLAGLSERTGGRTK